MVKNGILEISHLLSFTYHNNYIINGCVLTDILYSYILDKHIRMTNIKFNFKPSWFT